MRTSLRSQTSVWILFSQGRALDVLNTEDEALGEAALYLEKGVRVVIKRVSVDAENLN